MQRTLTQHLRRAGPQYASLLLTVLLTVACTPLQTAGRGDGSPDSARALARSGDHTAASRVYLDLALKNSAATRQRYLIFAAGELYLANDLDDAERILAEAGEVIATENLPWWAEVEAELRLARNQPEAALSALNKVSSTDRQQAADRILLLRSEALFQLGRAETAVATLLQREAVLSNRTAIEANRRLIWSGLQSTGQSIPPNPVARNGDPVLTGWLQLGYIAFRERVTLNGLYTALNQWRRDNRSHPASENLLDEVLANLNALSNYPRQVALLLPLSGRQQSYGEAIRDGYLTAHFELGANAGRPDIRFYDTARSGALAAYQRAMLDGAGFIIGPLLKSEVSEIAPAISTVTTLALNVAPEVSSATPNLFQFALAPEDEARAAADRAISENKLHAVALVEDSTWGRRVLDAFETELKSRGGTLLSVGTYNKSATDFSAAIRHVLLLDESYARRDRLAANLRKKLEFEPRRRQDVDFIFMASHSKEAKQIKPQLKFHYAGDIPTYATSGIFQPESTDNGDLNGIIFPDIPWLLKPTQNVVEHQTVLARYWGKNALRRARYYAMGYDSYHLTAMLHGRSGRNRLEMAGMTGTLRADDAGIVHRELDWARIERGRLRTLPSLQRGLTQEQDIAMTQP